jgi:hypothetical protein
MTVHFSSAVRGMPPSKASALLVVVLPGDDGLLAHRRLNAQNDLLVVTLFKGLLDLLAQLSSGELQILLHTASSQRHARAPSTLSPFAIHRGS